MVNNMNVYKSLPLIMQFIFTISIVSCIKESTSEKVEIPFILENDRIVIDAIINGKKGRFTFDTGATESYLDINVRNLLFTSYTTTMYNGKPKKVLIYHLNKITFGETELKTKSWVINRSDILINKKEEGYDGVLGNRVFEGYWCELSFSKSKIILHKEKPEYFINYSPVIIENKFDADFYVPVVIDDKVFHFNVDTGLFHAIYFPDGIIKFKASNEYQEVLSLEDVNQYHIVKISTIQLFDEIYTDAIVLTNSFLAKRRNNNQYFNDRGLLGLDFLKYYDLLFDYKELRKGKTTGMYYKSNTPLDKRNYGFFSFLKEVPQFGVLNFTIVNSELTIVSVIKESLAYTVFGLRPGTTITKINGKPITEFSRDELLESSFYLTVDNYTILENNNERIITSPLKNDY
jgi:hypothetical protein